MSRVSYEFIESVENLIESLEIRGFAEMDCGKFIDNLGEDNYAKYAKHIRRRSANKGIKF